MNKTRDGRTKTVVETVKAPAPPGAIDCGRTITRQYEKPLEALARCTKCGAYYEFKCTWESNHGPSSFAWVTISEEDYVTQMSEG
ncbi:MAG: hypothetical protein Q7T82_02860 [Armatimonadota bacterium]|nr:hypothetical protein [Armatimonadota bacterium]